MGEPNRTSYEDEQARLRKRFDGEPDEDVRIEIPKDPEVRPEVYKDVEALLFRGFITLPADINGCLVVFKSLNHHEHGMIWLLGGAREDAAPTSLFWNLFLAHCVFFVDGANVLADRDTALPKLIEFFSKLPHKARQKMIRHISEVNRRASNAVVLTEAYAMESVSRFRWAQFKNLDLTSSSVSGIVGTERLGLNWGQLLWRALNYFEDDHRQTEQEWEHAKFVGSCMAGKGISKVYRQDERRREKEKQDRNSRKDALIRHVLFGDPLDSKDPKGGVQVKAAHTVEELAAQLESDLRGNQDFHDRVVAAHEERVRQGYQDRRKQLEELAEQREREYRGKSLVGETILEGLSPEEVKERVMRSRQLQAQQAASRVEYPELENPKVAEFLNKWGVVEPPSDNTTNRDASTAIPIVPPRKPGTPFRR